MAVRGGGHNIAGTGVCDDGLVIDLSQMNDVKVDADARVARVQGGALLGDVDKATQAFGLATPGGVVSTTGVAGLTLGGGFGWLSRLYGLAADNLLAVEMVTADGASITASADENTELFWAVRGGGANFGVVTSFTFRLYEVGPEVLFGPTVYRLDDAVDVLLHYADFAATAPRNCCVWADLLTAPPLPFIPAAYHGTKILTLMQCYLGDFGEGEGGAGAVAWVRSADCRHRRADAVHTPRSSLLDETYAHGARNYWTSRNMSALSGGMIDGLVRLAAAMPTAAVGHPDLATRRRDQRRAGRRYCLSTSSRCFRCFTWRAVD